MHYVHYWKFETRQEKEMEQRKKEGNGGKERVR